MLQGVRQPDGILGVDYIFAALNNCLQIFLSLLAINLRQLVGFKIGDRNFEAGALISLVLILNWVCYLASCHLQEYFLTVWIEVEAVLNQVHLVQRRELTHESWASDGFYFPLGFFGTIG